jgi:hypothetical protein
MCISRAAVFERAEGYDRRCVSMINLFFGLYLIGLFVLVVATIALA